MTPMMPQQNGMMGQSNMLAGFGEDVLKKVLKSVSEAVSMQATEAIQAGVPYGHVLDQLVKMAPQGMSLQGGGSPPPGGDIGGNGNQPPQQPGGGMAKREDAMQALQQTSQINPGQLQNSPYQQPQQNLNQLLVPSQPQAPVAASQIMPPQGAMQGASTDPNGNVYQQGFGNEMLSRLLPGLIPGQSTNQALNQQNTLQDISLKRQKFAGQEPLQAGKREEIGLETQKAILTEAAKLSRQGLLQPGELLTKYEQASQPFIVMRDAYGRIQASNQDPTPAGDLSMLYAYMKMLDPGSTVREGELATAKDVGSVPSKVWQAYNSVLNGKKLDPKIRKDYFNRSGMLFKSAEKQQKSTSEGFAKLGQQSGIDPKIFMRDVGLSSNSQYTKTGTYNGQKVGMKPDGTIEVIR